MVKFLDGGDCWRLRKSLKLIMALVDPGISYYDFKVSVEIFNSLASIILQPTRLLLRDDEIKWIYLIAKNQEKEIDQDTIRLINSFLYSRKGVTAITETVQRIIYLNINDKASPEVNGFNFRKSTYIPKALVKILIEEKGNPEAVQICLLLSYMLVSKGFCVKYLSLDARLQICNFIQCGICEALLPFVDIYVSDSSKMEEVVCTILCITMVPSSIPRLLTAGLLKALVNIRFKCKGLSDDFNEVIIRLLAYDKKILQQLLALGTVSPKGPVVSIQSMIIIIKVQCLLIFIRQHSSNGIDMLKVAKIFFVAA